MAVVSSGTPIGVGLIGAGKHGQRYVNHVRRDVPELAIRALSRRDADRGVAQARELGARFHADWRDLVADPAVDAVVAVVPPTLHRPIAEDVARAGKALLIEKPLATTGADAEAIVRATEAAGIPVLMAHTLRWNSTVRAMRDLLPSLGPLRALGVNQRFEISELEWLDRPEISGGGIILHTGIHSLDLVRLLAGREIARVVCRTSRIATRRTEDSFAAVLELEGSDALVTVSGCRATGGRSGLVDAACADGQLVGDHQLGFAYRTRGLERTAVDLPAPAQTVCEALRSLVALITRGTAPPATPRDGAQAVHVAEACMRSARESRPVDVVRVRI